MLVNASQRPFGDQLCPKSGRWLFVSRRTPLPEALMTKSSGSLSPDWIAENAIRAPFGDQAKLRMSVYPAGVRSTAPLPSGLTANRWPYGGSFPPSGRR
jgi:hypothetical protein